MSILYFSFGSNLNIRHMQRRCQDAEPLSMFTLIDSRLVFRGVADCAYEIGAKCYGGLWRISAADEKDLDRFEGVASGFYRKEYVPLEAGKYEATHLMLYVMNSEGVFPPARHYLETIAQGYRDFRLPMDALKDAVRHSHEARQPSDRELSRYRRNGRPSLAAHPDGDRRPAAAPTQSNFRYQGKPVHDIEAWAEERRRDREAALARARELTLRDRDGLDWEVDQRDLFNEGFEEGDPEPEWRSPLA